MSARSPRTQAVDPLADLRQADATPESPSGLNSGPRAAPQRAVAGDGLEDVVRAWHDDYAASTFLHRGAACGCRHVAAVALEALAQRGGPS